MSTQSESYNQHQQDAVQNVSVGILTVSDTRTRKDDVGGRTIQEMLTAIGHRVANYEIVKDEPEEITTILRRWIAEASCDAIITTGGTGVASRDGTVEVVANLLQKRLDGFGELFRMLSYDQVGSGAMLSRALGGIVERTLIFTIPGSVAAVTLAMEKLICPELGHLVEHLRQ